MRIINEFISITAKKHIVQKNYYIIGDTLMSGEYYIWGDEMEFSINGEVYAVFPVRECYVTLNNKDEFSLIEGNMIAVENMKYRKYAHLILYPGHLYKIGKEIPEGYYFYKFDKNYFNEKAAFVNVDECGVRIYKKSTSWSDLVSGRCGNVLVDKDYVMVVNGCAAYYGNEKFDDYEYIKHREQEILKFDTKGTLLYSNEILELRVFEKYHDGIFGGDVVINLHDYYWYSMGDTCKWIAVIQPISFQNVKELKIEFSSKEGVKCERTFSLYENLYYKKSKEIGLRYIINTELPQDFYGNKLKITLKDINGVVINEKLESNSERFDDKSIKYIRSEFHKEFELLKKLLSKIDGIDIDKEITYLESAPDLLKYIINVLEDVIEKEAIYKDLCATKGKVSFSVPVTYDKTYYCVAKIADVAENIEVISNGEKFIVTFEKTQLEEIELMSYLLFNRNEEEIKNRNFLLQYSYRYYIINSMQQCIDELNNKYGYSTKVTNSVLLSIIKNENKKMQRKVDEIYSAITRENRVPTQWKNEYKLFSILARHIEEIDYQRRFEWLGKQSLDIYLVKENIAIEYQGEQHYRPIDFFGGESAFQKLEKRDARKKILCENNGVRVLEWPFDVLVTEETVREFMNKNQILYMENIEAKVSGNIMAPIILENIEYTDITAKKKLRSKPKRKSSIAQYDVSGKFIREYNTIIEAANQVGISSTSISKVLSGKRNTAAGYVWKKIELKNVKDEF